MSMTHDLEHRTRTEQQGVRPLVASAQRRWKLLVILAVLFGVAGGAAGYLRSPVYTARAELSVGEASLATQSLPGYASAVQNLAGVYSRLVTGTSVISPASNEIGVSGSDLASRVSASPVPASSVFRISVEAGSARSAVAQNRIVVREAVNYIATLSNDGSKDTARARNGYYRAARRASAKRLEAGRLQDRDGSSATIARLNARAALYQQDAQVWSQRYQASATATNQDFKGAEVLAPALSAADDRSSWTQKLALIGIVVGLLVGVAIGTSLDRRRQRPASV
jgi:hypothetical protein